MPLLLAGTAIGGFSASYPPGTEFAEGDLTFLGALGEQCAQAIDRARSVRRERDTRARFDALAAISRSLARTLDLRETTATIVRLALDHLGAEATLYAWDRGELAMLARASERGIETSLDVGVPASPAPDVVAASLAAAGQDRAPLLLDDVADPPTGGPLLLLPLGIADSTIGALVVADVREDVADALEFAREAARRMARALENSRLYRERDYVANTLQRSLLPAELPTVPGLQVEALFRPAFRGYEVGGDFYDVFEVDDGRWAAVVGDVCGKGVEAATLTGLARHTLRAISAVDRPSAALHALNRALLREALDGRFVTVVYALIERDRERGARVRVSSAGHPLPRRITNRGTAEPVGNPGTLLGILAEPHLEDVELRLDPGEMLVLYTDGILRRTEIAEDEPTALLESLAGAPPDSAADARERVERYLHEVFAAEQEDDVAVLFVRAP
jgi:serine phosphatase RsbU (regulator of sigma subunit)